MSGVKVIADKKKKVVSERRRYARISPSSPLSVRYRLVEAEKEPQGVRANTVSRSVSGGGLFLELPHLESGTLDKLLKGEKKLSLEIDIPGRPAPIKALARVIWVEGRRQAGRHFYGAGVSFLSIDENDRREIINYIIDRKLREDGSE